MAAPLLFCIIGLSEVRQLRYLELTRKIGKTKGIVKKALKAEASEEPGRPFATGWFLTHCCENDHAEDIGKDIGMSLRGIVTRLRATRDPSRTWARLLNSGHSLPGAWCDFVENCSAERLLEVLSPLVVRRMEEWAVELVSGRWNWRTGKSVIITQPIGSGLRPSRT